MGDNADLILDGYLDEYTGEYLGEGQGFPRSRYHNRTQNNKHNANDLNTCMNFLRTRFYKTNDERCIASNCCRTERPTGDRSSYWNQL